MGAFSSMAENASAPLDLNRTLEQISQDVALRVLEETGGNQTAAAKRLGISRTTLWRLLQKQELRQRMKGRIHRQALPNTRILQTMEACGSNVQEV